MEATVTRIDWLEASAPAVTAQVRDVWVFQLVVVHCVMSPVFPMSVVALGSYEPKLTPKTVSELPVDTARL